MRLGSVLRPPAGILRVSSMQGRRFDRILTGTAIALVLGLAQAGPALAQSQSSIEALVPLPEPANLPPPTPADVGGATTQTTGSTPLQLPHPPELPPPPL